MNRKAVSICCSLLIGGVILLSACKHGTEQGQQNAIAKDSTAKATDTITPRIAQYSKRIASNPNDADAYWKRGILEAALKKYDNALKDYNAAIKIDSSKAMYYYSLADVDFIVGHTRDSKDEFQKCINLDPKNTDAMLRLGEIYFDVKKYDDAIKLIDQALKVNPYIARAYFLKGMIFLENKDTAKAVSSMQTAVEQDGKYYDAYVQLGLIFTRKGNPIALDYFNDAINARPGNVEAYYDKGMFYQSTGDYDNAIKAYQELLQIVPNYKFAYYDMGVIYYIQKKDYQQAITNFSKAIQIDSAYSLAYYGRGNSYEQLKQNEKALDDFRAATHYNQGFSAAADAYRQLQAKMNK